jgi:hypothetical protein
VDRMLQVSRTTWRWMAASSGFRASSSMPRELAVEWYTSPVTPKLATKMSECWGAREGVLSPGIVGVAASSSSSSLPPCGVWVRVVRTSAPSERQMPGAAARAAQPRWRRARMRSAYFDCLRQSAVGRRAPGHVAAGRQSQSGGGRRRQSGQRFGSKPQPQNFFWRLRRIETLSLRRRAAASSCHELVCGCRRRHVGCQRVPVRRTNDIEHQRSDCASSSLARDDVANVTPVRLAPKFIFGRRRRPLVIPRWRHNFHLFQPGVEVVRDL